MATKKLSRRAKLKFGIRKKISGSPAKPRLSVYRSNKGIYAQLIDDISGSTVISVSSLKNSDVNDKLPKVDQSKLVGKLLAEKAVASGITEVVFDRNGYLYHGRIKSLAEGAREGGLKF